MRLIWFDIVKHVKDGPTEENPASVAEEAVAVDVVAESLDAFAEAIRKLRRDVDRIDRANYRAAGKAAPPGVDEEVPLEPPPAAPAETDLPTVINNLRPGEPIPPQFHYLIR